MANAKYDEGREAIAKATIDLDTATIDLVAVEAYTFDPTHSSGDLTNIVDTDASLGSNAVDSEGYFSTADAVLTGLAVGDDPTAFIMRVQGGVLLAYIDTLDGDVPVEGTIIGDGTNVTIHKPSPGWFRV